MFINLIISFIAAAGIIFLLWIMRGIMLMPVSIGENQRMEIILTISGAAPELERTVNALWWLKENGTLQGDIILRNNGMDAETEETAKLLCRRGVIKIIC